MAETLPPAKHAAPAETKLWRAVLGDLEGQMTTAIFDKWLRGRALERVGEGYVVRARDQCGAEWLANRLARMIMGTLARHVGDEVAVQFTV